MSEFQLLLGSFAEIIVAKPEPAEVWPTLLARLRRAVDFDAGYIAASWGDATEGRGAVAAHDAPFLRKNLGRFLAEIRPEEVALYTDRARVHHEVWSPARQQELAVFRELLFPTGMQHMIVRTSVRHGNVAGINLERRSSTPFTARELRLVDVVAPLLHVVEMLTLCSSEDSISSEFAREHYLTERESQLVALITRGLQNAEMALLMKVSTNTIRNSLVRVFEKVGVANRAELTYLATRPSGSLRRSSVSSSRGSARKKGFGDGLQAFRLRVEQASQPTLDEDESAPAKSGVHIVYTPPLTSKNL